MEKDRVTKYWDNEIKHAAENTAKALAEFRQAKKEEEQAHDRKIEAGANNADANTLEEMREIHKQKSIYMSHKRDAYWMASKWECEIREAAASYKERKAANEANK